MVQQRGRLAVAILMGLLPRSTGHGWLDFPPLRGGASGSSMNAYCPHCGNGAGVCGDGGQWGNSDFLGLSEGAKTVFTPGEIAEFSVKVTAHHKGHFEFGICDQRLGHGTADPQGCLDKHKLLRAPRPRDCVANDARGDCQLVDVHYPERWYLPPGIGTYKMRFQIPQDLQCSSCTLQWRWWSANSCIPAPGYSSYFSQMKASGWKVEDWCGSCVEGDPAACTGEEFRNCADISVLGSVSGSPTPNPTPSPSPSPSSSTTTSSTRATPSPPSSPSPSPAVAEGACVRNLDCSANAWCAQESYVPWCAAQGARGHCPFPQCSRAAVGTTMPTPAAATTTSYAATDFSMSAPSPMPTQTPTSAAPTSTSASPTKTVGSACAPVFECGAEFSWCDNAKLVAFCSAGDASGQCPPTWCRQGLAEPEPEPEPEVVALQATAGRPKSKGQSFLGMALLQAGRVMERATELAWEELGEL